MVNVWLNGGAGTVLDGGPRSTKPELEVASTVTEMLTLAKFPTCRSIVPDSPAFALPVQVAVVPLEEHVRGVPAPKVPPIVRIVRGSITVRVVVVVKATNAETVIVPATKNATASISH